MIIQQLLPRNSRVSASAKSCAATALIWLVACAAVSEQTGPGVAFDRAAKMEAICRQYAAALTGMPTNLMFNRCMLERDCRVSPGSPGYQCELPGPVTWHDGGR